MVAAAERLAARGERRIGLLFLVGEENGSDGARAAADFGPRGRFLINGEPTENRLSIGQKGSLRVDLDADGPRRALGVSRGGRQRHRGAARHASSASGGCRCPAIRCSGQSTLNVGLIDGGVAPNVLAPHASAQLLFRTVEPTGRAQGSDPRRCSRPASPRRFPVELPFHKGGTRAGRAGTRPS